MGTLDIGLTSDANYDKIAMKGSGTLAPGAFSSDTDTITHSLGYKPNVRVWYEPDNDGDIYPARQSNNTATLTYLIKDNTLEITATNQGVGTLTVPYYYRIYHDGETLDDNALDNDRDTEKILDTIEGTLTVSGGFPAPTTDTTDTIAHGLGREEFVRMIFSRDGGEKWFEESTFAFGSYYAPSKQNQFVIAYAHMDDTNVYVEVSNGYTSQQTIDYKIAILRRN